MAKDTLWRRNIAENFNRLSGVHERYRQTDDGRTTTYSKRVCIFFRKEMSLTVPCDV